MTVHVDYFDGNAIEDMLNDVIDNSESYVISKENEPVVVVMPYDSYLELCSHSR